MRYFRPALAALILIALLTSGCTALVRPNFTPEMVKLRPGQYQIDPMHGYLIFKVEHLGLSKIIGRFNKLDASLEFDPEQIENMQLNAVVTTDSIDLNNADLESTLQEADWFNTASFPQITFNSQAVTLSDNGDLNISGNLSMRGVSQPINLVAKFNGGADNMITRKYTIGFSASAQINRSDFGMDGFSAFVGDTVEIEAHGEFLKQ